MNYVLSSTFHSTGGSYQRRLKIMIQIRVLELLGSVIIFTDEL